MLQLTRKVEYALAIIAYMHQTAPQELHSARIISMHSNIPFDMVTKCLQRMSKQGLCQAVQGKNGGYRLACDFDRVTLGEFLSDVGEPVALVECIDQSANCAQFGACCLVGPMRKLNRLFNDLLCSMTLSEFLNTDEEKPPCPAPLTQAVDELSAQQEVRGGPPSTAQGMRA